jgi:poly(3-hydroxybutyrate) depolymerase
MIRTPLNRMRCHKQNPHSAIALIAGIVLATAAHAEPYSAASVWQMQRLGDPDISPDGRLAVVPVTRFDVEKNKGETDLWLVPTKPGKARQLTTSASSASTPVWSPDG